MEFFRIRRTIPFMRHALVFNVISALLFVASVGLLITRGLHFSIEFTGGTVMEVSYEHLAERSTGSASRTCRCRTSAPPATC
jgi:preprotein translocase subunit SecF